VSPAATTWVWFALVDDEPVDATAFAAATEPDGTPAGHLAAWARRARPTRDARRIDARVIDPEGARAQVSLVRPPAGVRLPFDDGAVQQARRATLAGPPFDAVSTLLADAKHFEGARTVARRGQNAPHPDDPFARIFPARRLDVGPGLLGAVPPPPGPTIERYGSAQPWPWDRFPDPTG
jgi:hypothetical protein